MTTQVDNVSLVTGASSGIGRAVANALGRERGCVALVGRDEARLRRAAHEVEMFGGKAIYSVSDVRDAASIQGALARVLDTWGRIDTAILSAGIAQSVSLERFQSAALEDIVETNLYGVARWLEVLHPILRAQPSGGTIAVISSLSADRALPGGGAGYSASKAAVSHLCDGLRAPFARQGVRLVTVEPGFVRTPMLAGMTWTPASVSPERSAAFILDGLRRGQQVIRYPYLASLTMSAICLLPPALLDKLYRPE